MQDIGTKGKAGMEGIKVQGENKGKITQEGGINQMGTSAPLFVDWPQVWTTESHELDLHAVRPIEDRTRSSINNNHSRSIGPHLTQPGTAWPEPTWVVKVFTKPYTSFRLPLQLTK